MFSLSIQIANIQQQIEQIADMISPAQEKQDRFLDNELLRLQFEYDKANETHDKISIDKQKRKILQRKRMKNFKEETSKDKLEEY